MKKTCTVSTSLPRLLLSGFLALSACQEKGNPAEQAQTRPQHPTEPTPAATPPATPPSTAPNSTEVAVAAIRREFARINSAPLDSLRKPFRCDTDGTVTFYSEGGNVVKAVIDWGFLGDGSTTSEYYYQNGRLIFFYETYTGGPAGEPETTNDERLYVRNDRVIRFLKNQRPAPCSPCVFGPDSRPYRVLAAFRSGNPALARLCRVSPTPEGLCPESGRATRAAQLLKHTCLPRHSRGSAETVAPYSCKTLLSGINPNFTKRIMSPQLLRYS